MKSDNLFSVASGKHTLGLPALFVDLRKLDTGRIRRKTGATLRSA